jgi:hypothetical protein
MRAGGDTRRRYGIVLVLVVASGCGRVAGNDERVDATPDAGLDADAEPGDDSTFSTNAMSLAERVGDTYVSRALSELGVGTPSYLTPDACTLFFHDNRDGGAGGLDVYMSKRDPPPSSEGPPSTGK